MGLFDKLKKKMNEDASVEPEAKTKAVDATSVTTDIAENDKSNSENLLDELKEQFDKVNKTVPDETDNYKAPGWSAITDIFEKIYPNQKYPLHYGTIQKWSLGGRDPLDGISIYDAGHCWHFVSYGLSDLYAKSDPNSEYSGYGIEFTAKLRKNPDIDNGDEIRSLCGVFQSVARVIYETGRVVKPDEFLYTGQTEGVDVRHKSNITGFLTAVDPRAGTKQTPFGRITFIELIGATFDELESIKRGEHTVKQVIQMIGNDWIDYRRSSSLAGRNETTSGVQINVHNGDALNNSETGIDTESKIEDHIPEKQENVNSKKDSVKSEQEDLGHEGKENKKRSKPYGIEEKTIEIDPTNEGAAWGVAAFEVAESKKYEKNEVGKKYSMQLKMGDDLFKIADEADEDGKDTKK